MVFTDLSLPVNLTTGYQNPNEDFFTPVLSAASSFDIAVGYFTSGWLEDVIEGIHKMAINGSSCRIIVSPNLDPKDLEVIKRDSSPTLNENGVSEIEQLLLDEITILKTDKRSLLSNLITCGLFKFKIATPKSEGINLFHAKIGYATDSESNEIAFNGSFNLTANAKSNWEYIDIFQADNKKDIQRIENIKLRFQTLWDNNDPFYNTTLPSNALKNKIKEYSTNASKQYPQETDKINIKLRPYQEAAIKSWWNNQGKGMFVMATGSGKTITALSAVNKVVSRHKKLNKPLIVIFVLPLKHLLEQWHEEAKLFNFEAIKCYETSSVWRESLSEAITNLTVRNDGVMMAMVTNKTLSSDNFQKIINNTSITMMVVADEAHNLGSESYLKSLPKSAQIRLGLTATPDRYNDIQGTTKLIHYFDKVVFEFTLEDAINAGYLVNYNYYPFLCEFNHEEFLEYKEIVKQLDSQQKSLVEAEAELDHITGRAANKIIILRKQLEDLQAKNLLKHTLVYCGSHKDEEGSRQIEQITKLLGKELGVKVRKFTADESIQERRAILDLFAKGDLHSIAAIKCLDEGVDVPATKQAFVLSSTANPREFIQRRGRVLRRSVGKSMANIFDFIMIPPPGEVNTYLVTREVLRGLEYNSLASNRLDNERIFEDLIYEHEVDLEN